MRIQITGEELTITVKASRSLTTQEIVTCHQLATGNFEALFVDQPEDEVQEDKEDGDEMISKSKVKFPRRGEKVKSLLECPICGCSRRIDIFFGNRFTTCKVCNTKLFNALAGKQFGEFDKLGYYYRINAVFKDADGKDAFDSDSLLKEMGGNE